MQSNFYYVILFQFLSHIIGLFRWMVMTIISLFQNVYGDLYKTITEKTALYEKEMIPKTVPTPCDKEMWLYNLNINKNIKLQKEKQQKKHQVRNKTLGCTW